MRRLRAARSGPQCSAARSSTQRSSASISASSGGSSPRAGERREDPRVAERAAGDHHRVGARLAVGVARPLGRAQAAGDDHGHPGAAASSRDELAHERVVGPAGVALAAARGCRVMAATPASATRRRASSTPERSPARRPDRSFTVTGRPSPRPRPARPRGPVGSSSSAAPAPVFRTFFTGQPKLRSISRGPAGRDRGGLAHHGRVAAEELDRDRPLVGVDPQHLLERAPVAVGDREARDHLGDREPSPVAVRLQAHEPVADPGERRQQHAVRDGRTSAMRKGAGRAAGWVMH